MADLHDTHHRDPALRPGVDRLREIPALDAQTPLGERADREGQQSAAEAHRVIDPQRHVARLLQSGGPAMPLTLRTRLESLTERSGRHRRVAARKALNAGWARSAAAFAGAGLAAITVIAIEASTGKARGPAATQFAATWTRPATSRAVTPSPGNSAMLDVAFHGTAFPNYHDSEGWHPVGTRTDVIARKDAFTVYYATGDRRAAYTVVAGTDVTVPAGAHRFVADGLPLMEFRDGDRWVVVFRSRGNSCVLTAAAPREREWLVKLAVWRGGSPGNSRS